MIDYKWLVCSWATQQKSPAVNSLLKNLVAISLSLLKSSVAISPTAKKPFQWHYLSNEITHNALPERAWATKAGVDVPVVCN